MPTQENGFAKSCRLIRLLGGEADRNMRWTGGRTSEESDVKDVLSNAKSVG